ncbi:MAG: NPCBM/NEW2 domain-containing protein [Thermincolia bacterium]
MAVITKIIDSRRKSKVLLIIVIALVLAVSASILTPVLAQEKPVTIYVHGMEVTSEVPAFIMNGRTYLPATFVNDILNINFTWDPKTRTVIRMGVPQSGINMIKDLPAFTGKEMGGSFKVKGVTYSKGYKITSKNEIRWNLKGLFDRVTFSFGIPDGAYLKGDVGFTVLADGQKIAEETVDKDDKLKEFSFDVTGVNVLTIKPYKQEGGVLFNPRLYQAETTDAESLTGE